MQKNKAAQKFDKGSVVRAAGKIINAKSGPVKGSSYRLFPETKLIFPMYENTTKADKNPHIHVNAGISNVGLMIYSDLSLYEPYSTSIPAPKEY